MVRLRKKRKCVKHQRNRSEFLDFLGFLVVMDVSLLTPSLSLCLEFFSGFFLLVVSMMMMVLDKLSAFCSKDFVI